MRPIFAKSQIALSVIAIASILTIGVAGFKTAPTAATKNTSGFTTSNGTVTLKHTFNLAAMANSAKPPKLTKAQIQQYQDNLKYIANLAPKYTKSTTSKTLPVVKPEPAIIGPKQVSISSQFNGLQAVTNETTNGFDVEPPDEGMAYGNNYVFNFVNLSGEIYNTSGTALVPAFSMNNFFNVPFAISMSDPRVYYDNASQRWFAVALAYSTFYTEINFAVSQTNNPLGSWSVYALNATELNDPWCPCLPDYPVIGMDGYNLYITANEFSTTTGVFNGAEIWAIAKTPLLSGLSSPFVRFGQIMIAGNPAYHIQPAIKRDALPAELFVASIDPTGTSNNQLAVWSMADPWVVATGGMPSLTSTIIASEYYAFPVPLQTPVGYNTAYGYPTTGLLSPDFDAMQEVEYINGQLFGALDTAANVLGTTSDSIAWFEIKPILNADNTISSATHITDQGYLATPTSVGLLYPHIEVTKSGFGAIVFSYGGPNTPPSVGVALREPNQTFGPDLNTIVNGQAPDNGFTDVFGVGRWGDYSAGSYDPTTGSIWLAAQYIPNSGNGDIWANWGNYIFNLPQQ